MGTLIVLAALTMTAGSEGLVGSRLDWGTNDAGLPEVRLGGKPLVEIQQGSTNLPNIREDQAGIYFDNRFKLPESGSGRGAEWGLVHHIQNPRHIWIPHVSPYEDTVIGDHSLRSPAILISGESQLFAILIDPNDIAAAHKNGWNIWLDYDHPNRTIKIAGGAYKVGKFHVAYQPTDLAYKGQEIRIRVHMVASDKKEHLENPYGLIASELWKRWGRAGYLAGGSQRASFQTYANHVVNWAFAPEPKGWGDTVWQQFTANGLECGAPAFIVDVAQHPSVPMDQRKWREQRSVWNQAWFSTQRTANGLLRYARRTQSEDLQRRARLMTNVALAAPQKDGLFPAVYTTGSGQWYQLYKDTASWDQGRWTNSNRRPGDASENAIHILDASFTARLLLEWADLNPKQTEVVDYVLRYADRLVKLQAIDGSFPGWVEPDGKVPETLKAGPESAMSASFLLDLVKRFPKRPEYRQAAERALTYLENGPVKESRWEDFETYFSCSRWGEDRVGKIIERNGVYKSNTFSPFWCAEAFLKGHQVLKGGKYLALGRRCLDELSLYQQIWEPSNIPAPTHGGFGVMNADGEWNDSRQSLFAPLYLEYYRATGFRDYFERGVSALRASFAMMYCPENQEVKSAYEAKHPFFGPESYGFMMENIAHGGPGPGPDQIGPFNIFTWGNGAALEAAAKVHDLYGDIYVDLDRKAAFGIDGTQAELKGDRLEIAGRYGRSEVEVVTAKGKRVKVKMEAGKASVDIARLR